MQLGRFKRSSSWEDSNNLAFGRLKRSIQNSLRRNQKRPAFFARYFLCFVGRTFLHFKYLKTYDELHFPKNFQYDSLILNTNYHFHLLIANLLSFADVTAFLEYVSFTKTIFWDNRDNNFPLVLIDGPTTNDPSQAILYPQSFIV